MKTRAMKIDLGHEPITTRDCFAVTSEQQLSFNIKSALSTCLLSQSQITNSSADSIDKQMTWILGIPWLFTLSKAVAIFLYLIYTLKNGWGMKKGDIKR